MRSVSRINQIDALYVPLCIPHVDALQSAVSRRQLVTHTLDGDSPIGMSLLTHPLGAKCTTKLVARGADSSHTRTLHRPVKRRLLGFVVLRLVVFLLHPRLGCGVP